MRLTAQERKQLNRCESAIGRANRYDLERATALRTIREQRLYRATHTTFEAYCQERWGFSRQHASRLIDHAEVAENLSPIGDIPRREAHARPLATLTPSQQQRAWKLYLGTRPSRHSAAAIATVAKAVKLSPANGDIEDLPYRPSTMDTPLRWYGAKTRLAARIVATFPPHRTYIEPFCGSCAVLFAKQPSEVEIVNDAHEEIVNFFTMLRSRPKDLQRLVKLTPFARQEHKFCVENPSPEDDLERARRLFVRCRQSYGGRLDDTWGLSFQRNSADWTKSATDNLLITAERFRAVQVEKIDFRKLLKRTPDRKDILVYMDPPYLPELRSHGSDSYQHEMSGDDHLDLLDLATAFHRASIAISGYRSKLYDQRLKDWKRYEWRQRTNVANFGKGGRGACYRTEVLWANW